MKRVGNLKETWCNYDSLLFAFQEVKKNKNYHHGILEFESNLVCNLNRILESLENKTYKVKPARAFYVYDPKERLIEAPHIEDRIVQHAVLNSVKNHIEKRFVDQSYACRIGKGTHHASDKLKSYLANYSGKGYCLKIDIEKYFYTIDHKIIEQLLRRIIKCEPTIELLKKFYENETGKGLPLGNVTSQTLANLMLNPVDHMIKRFLKRKHYIRYMDDLVILGKTKEGLRRVLRYVNIILKGLKLKANNKTQITPLSAGVDFVGYRTWFNNRLIRKRSLHRIKRKLKADANMTRVSSFLSHSKRTNSLLYVVKQILKVAAEYKEFIRQWLINNNKIEVYYEIFPS